MIGHNTLLCMLTPTMETARKASNVAFMNSTVRRFVVAGAVALGAAAVPAAIATATAGADPEVSAGPACLAWFGNKEDGKCLSYSNGTPVTGGTPGVGFGGAGLGIYTGPLLPGATWNVPIG